MTSGADESGGMDKQTLFIVAGGGILAIALTVIIAAICICKRRRFVPKFMQCRIAMGRRVPLPRLEKAPGSLAHYLARSVKEGQWETSIDTLNSGSGQIAVEEGCDGLAGLLDLVVVARQFSKS